LEEKLDRRMTIGLLKIKFEERERPSCEREREREREEISRFSLD
jgi:hypothetical protein